MDLVAEWGEIGLERRGGTKNQRWQMKRRKTSWGERERGSGGVKSVGASVTAMGAGRGGNTATAWKGIQVDLFLPDFARRWAARASWSRHGHVRR
uniref:DUF834 domain-containing protein n=1 Tax=Leersia perrieri TaxID=77586 RepID=A0A0D9XLJ3_9ORYZ